MSCQFVSMLQNMILLGGISTSGSKPSAAGSVREGDAREQRAAFRLARNGTAWKRSVADFAATRSGQRGSNSLPGIPRIGSADSQEPCRTSHFICALRMGGGSEFAFYEKNRTSESDVLSVCIHAAKHDPAGRHIHIRIEAQRSGFGPGRRRKGAARSFQAGPERDCLETERRGLCGDAERATRLELASRYPTNRLCRFAGALPDLPFYMRSAHR